MHCRRFSMIVGVAAVLCLPAGAGQAAGPSDQDATFLRAAHQNNLAEIAAGRIAWTKTKDPKVKDLAATFMRDHIYMDADLYLKARQLRVLLPSVPTPEQQALAERYRIAGADTFDEYYITTQLTAHREAHAMAAEQAESGATSEVKELARNAVPIIAHHQEKLRDAAASEGIAGYAAGGGRAR